MIHTQSWVTWIICEKISAPVRVVVCKLWENPEINRSLLTLCTTLQSLKSVFSILSILETPSDFKASVPPIAFLLLISSRERSPSAILSALTPDCKVLPFCSLWVCILLAKWWFHLPHLHWLLEQNEYKQQNPSKGRYRTSG